MTEPDIVINSELTAEERAGILARYLNRDTLDSPWNEVARRMIGAPAPTQTDQEWIDSRVWRRLPDGSIRIAPKP